MIEKEEITFRLPSGKTNISVFLKLSSGYKELIETEKEELINSEQEAEIRVGEIKARKDFISYQGAWKENEKIRIKYIISEPNPESREEFGRKRLFKHNMDFITEAYKEDKLIALKRSIQDQEKIAVSEINKLISQTTLD